MTTTPSAPTSAQGERSGPPVGTDATGATGATDATAARSTPAPRRWATPGWAAVGVAFLVVQAMTWSSYLASGPSTITTHRDTSSAPYLWAKAFEATQVVIFVAVMVWLVRGVRREGRITTNVMWVIAFASIWWLDPMLNYFRPGFYYSSNFVNIESWVTHIPGQLAPHANRVPEPVLWTPATYVAVFLLFGLVLVKVMELLRERWPTMPALGLIAGAWVAGAVLDLALELPLIRTGTFAYPAAVQDWAIWGGQTYQFPFVQLIGATTFWTACAAVVFFGREHGSELLDRGAERFGRGQTLARILARVGFVHVTFLLLPMGVAQIGPWYSDDFPTYPPHLSHEWCGDDGEPYGPCPGPGVPWQTRR